MTRSLIFLLLVVPGFFSLGGCSLFEGESVMSRLELDRIFHRTDATAERAKREREARDRLAGAYWGMRSDTLERESARPDPNRAPLSPPTPPAQIASTGPAIPPASTTSAASAPKPAPSPARPAPRAPVATTTSPPAPTPKAAPTPPPRATTVPVLATLDPARTAASEKPVAASAAPSTPPAEPAEPAKPAAPLVMQPVFYGTASDPSKLLEGEGERPLYTAREIVTKGDGQDEIDLFHPPYGSMKLPQESAAVGVSVSGYQSDGGKVGKPAPEEEGKWAEMILSIRPYSSRPGAPE